MIKHWRVTVLMDNVESATFDLWVTKESLPAYVRNHLQRECGVMKVKIVRTVEIDD